MSLHQLSNQEINHRLVDRISKEKEILSEILHLIVEVDRRKLFLEWAYPSFFDFLTKHHGYSNGSAQRRIEAARLMKDVPDLPSRLESGAINLSQIGFMQKTIRQNKIQVSKEEKIELIQSLEYKSFAESQILVANAFDIEVKEQTQIQHQKDESVRMQVTLSKEQWQKIKHMQELLSHSLPNGSDLVQTIEYLADRVIKQKTTPKVSPKPSQNTILPSISKAIQNIEDSAKKANSKLNLSSNIIAAPNLKTAVHQFILQRDQCCQYEDPHTQRKCGSKTFLQIGHIKPKWAGGENRIENLQVLCANHNRYKYQKQTGIKIRV